MSDHLHGAVRSWLFVPGNNERRVEKAFASDADAVILDLEDAVAIGEKLRARTVVCEAVRRASRDLVFVRVNALGTNLAYEDIAAVAAARPAGIMLPKAESAEDIRLVSWLLKEHERKQDLPDGCIEILPLIETGAGMLSCAEIVSSCARVRKVSFGAGDFSLDLSMHWSRDESEFLAYRNQLVLASRAARKEPPIDAVWVQLSDKEGMALSAARARNHGFQGKLCIHPDQVAAVNLAYRPSPEAVERAERIVEAFDQAEAQGAAALQVDGKLIDYPIVAAARAMLADAARAERRGSRKVSDVS